MKTTKHLFLFIVIAIGLTNCAESEKSAPANSSFTKIDESKYKWKQELMTIIDLSDPANKHLNHLPENAEGESFTDVILDGAKSVDSLLILDPIFEDIRITMQEINEKLSGRVETSWVTQPDPPYELEEMVTTDEFNNSVIVLYRLKEVWYTDADGNVGDKRVVSICPVTQEVDDAGNIKGYKPIFWMNLESAKNVLANANTTVDGKSVSFWDVFYNKNYKLSAAREDRGPNNVNKKVALFESVVREYESINANTTKYVQEVWSDISVSHDLWEREEWIDLTKKDVANRDFLLTFGDSVSV